MNDLPKAHIEGGEVSFPLWVKALAWIVGLAFPIAGVAGFQMASAMIAMNDRLSRMEEKLQGDDRYRSTQSRQAHEILQMQIERNAEDIDDIHRRLGIK